MRWARLLEDIRIGVHRKSIKVTAVLSKLLCEGADVTLDQMTQAWKF